MRYENINKQHDEYPFDYDLAQPTDMQLAEERGEIGKNVRGIDNVGYHSEPMQTKLNGIEIAPVTSYQRMNDDARQYGQKQTGTFIPPFQHPKTYAEIMDNWREKDEYDKQKWDRAEKWRTIGEAILGAGEIAARALSGASGQNTMPQYMMQQNAQGLDELKYLRQQNKDRFMQQIGLMQQQDQLRLQQAKYDREMRQWDAEFRLKLQQAENDARRLEQQGKLAEAQALRAKAAEEYDRARAGGFAAESQSRIALNKARQNAAYASANKANSDAAKAKSEQSLYVGGKQYALPKGMNIGNALRAVQNNLSQKFNKLTPGQKQKAREYIAKTIDKFHDDSYNGIASIINAIAHDFPNETKEALEGMDGVKVTAESTKSHAQLEQQKKKSGMKKKANFR